MFLLRKVRLKQRLDGDMPSVLGIKKVEFKEIQNYKKTNRVERDTIRQERPRRNKIRYNNDRL